MPADAPDKSEITRLLSRWNEGDREALATLASVAYGDLRAIAVGYLRREPGSHTLQATALVNELYLRLARINRTQFNNREHFYGFAAQLMRMILIDHARQAHAIKRPPAHDRIPLHEEIAWVDASSEDMLALDRALDQLAEVDERKVRVVELRYFLGCTNEESAQLLGVSRPTVERDLEYAKAWLFRRLRHGALPAT